MPSPAPQRAAHPPAQRPTARSVQRGLSIVELMVGVTISLFILAGATMLLTSQLGDNRRLLLEAQVQQDMRAAADLIARDLRRAGYWAQSYRQVWADPGAGAVANPYRVTTPASAPSGTSSLVYDRSTDEDGRPLGTDDNTVSAAERVGFRYSASSRAIEMQVSDGNWQALTDPAVLSVTQFEITYNVREVAVPSAAAGSVPALGPGGCPLTLRARDATIVIVAQAAHDARVQRSLRDTVRLRNDVVGEACP